MADEKKFDLCVVSNVNPSIRYVIAGEDGYEGISRSDIDAVMQKHLYFKTFETTTGEVISLGDLNGADWFKAWHIVAQPHR
jgi:hypothetical protein